MKTLTIRNGTHIDSVADLLVKNAPASTVFNGIRVRAKYRTTCPWDIVKQYRRAVEKRDTIWCNSPAGRARAAGYAAAQENVIEFEHDLETLDFNDPAAVLAWVEPAALAFDSVGITWNRFYVLERFAQGGWLPEAYEGSNLDRNSARQYAGWIVGQWLAHEHPRLGHWCDEWRSRFAREEVTEQVAQ